MVDAYFLDSSTLLKRYVPEVGTAWIQSITDAQNQNLLIVAHIAWVEISSAVARRQREGNISNIQANQVLAAFRAYWTQYFIVAIDHTVMDLAGQLVNQHPLRAYDAVQLAAALSLQKQLSPPNVASFTFLTADTRLLTIAQAENLLADDPNLHP